MKFKPKGYNSVSPYFIINDAPAFIAMLKKIFDAHELRSYAGDDGSVVHAEYRILDSVVMLAQATQRFPQVPLVLHVYVPDVDAVFDKALAAGCEIVERPAQRAGDPDRRATFTDFAGNMWSVGTEMPG